MWVSRPLTHTEGNTKLHSTDFKRKIPVGVRRHRSLEKKIFNSFPLFHRLLAHLCRYFHKIPAEPPQLELKASYGLAEPVTFELPPLSEQCSPEVYATFDLTKGAKNEKVLRFVNWLCLPFLVWWSICIGCRQHLLPTPTFINTRECFPTLLFRPNPRRRRWSQWRSPIWSLRKTRDVSSPKPSMFSSYSPFASKASTIQMDSLCLFI